MITWWDPLSQAHPSACAVSAGTLDEAASPKAAKLHFLIESQDGLTSRLVKYRSVKGVYFSGPYGQDLHLDNYENVILVAQGIGIAGILPHALHLTRRHFHKNAAYRRGLATRRVDIFWLLEENSQESWAAEYLLLLQSMDPQKVCMYLVYSGLS
jgi:predicted ferric reductase